MKRTFAWVLASALILSAVTTTFSQDFSSPAVNRGFPASSSPRGLPVRTVSAPDVAPQAGSAPVSAVPGTAAPRSGTRVIQATTASLQCLHKLQVSAQSDGMIESLFVDEGSWVKKGDPLLMIDGRVAAAELEVARKELEAAQKTAAQTADIEYAKAAARVAINEYNAENELFGKGSAAKAQVERRRLEADKTRLGIEVAEVKHETEILAAEVAAAKLEAAKVKLEMYNVAATYDGVIIERLRDQGEWIRAGEPVLKLMSLNELKVEAILIVDGFSIPDLQRAPMKVTVEISPGQRYEIPTTVEFVNPEYLSDRIRVFARIQNQKVGDAWLLGDGMLVKAEIELPNR